MGFTHFKFHPAIAAGIREAGYSHPTPIQKEAIPQIIEGKDVLGLAQTGTGKTAAFALPILHRLSKGERHITRALIVAPTRELAEQIEASFKLFSHQSGLKSATVYGGVGQGPQVTALKKGTEIIVACPGRLLDLIEQGHANMGKVEVLVLDEADMMFDMGFLPVIRRILQKLPKQRQTLLFSATMPDEIRKLAEDMLRDPVTIQVDKVKPASTVRHALYPIAQHLKTPLLMELLDKHSEGSILVFTRTKHRAKRIGEQLQKAGQSAASIQGNLSQNRRQEAMDGFRDGTYRILVATDIAARGIDVSLVSLVVNYDVPETPDMYIHRIGRTGRAERSGEAVTFVTGEDTAMVKAVERLLGKPIERKTVRVSTIVYQRRKKTRNSSARLANSSSAAIPGPPGRVRRKARRSPRRAPRRRRLPDGHSSSPVNPELQPDRPKHAGRSRQGR